MLTLRVSVAHHGIAAVIGQNDNVNRRGVVGYAYSSFFRSILSGKIKEHRLNRAIGMTPVL